MAFGIGLAPSIIWLVFFELEEREKPKRFSDLAFAFIAGSLTTFVALLIQIYAAGQLGERGIDIHSVMGVSLFATIEEVIKFLGVLLLVLSRKSFDEPLDAMIYMISVALGFAAVENIASLINSGAVATAFSSVKSIEVITLRFLGATLLHAVASGVIGFHWAVGWVRHKLTWLHILIGIIIACLLHTGFNILVLRFGPAGWALVFVAIIAFFVLVDFEELRTEEERIKV